MEESQLATFAGGELRAEGEIERKRRTCPSDRETGGRVEEGKKKGGGSRDGLKSSARRSPRHPRA